MERQARVTVETLQKSPPKTLQQLYTALLEEIRVIRKEIDLLEAEFYDGDTPFQFLTSWSAVVKDAMECHSLSELNSLRQIQSIIFLSRDPEVKELYPNMKQLPQETCEQLSRLQNKILAFVPGRFTLVMDKITRVQSLCDKYLLSFFSLDSPHNIETAKKYTMNRRTWNTQVYERIKNVLYNPHLFLRESISIARMEKSTLDLLRRAGMLSAPFLGLFTDECEHLKESLRVMTEWISYDKNYPTFIKTDMMELEKRRSDLMRQLKAQKHQLHMAQYRTKSLQAEKAKLHVELQSLAEKEADLLVEEEQVFQDLNTAKIDMEIKEFRKEEIRKEAKEGLVSDAEAQTQLTVIGENLRQLRADIPQMERKLASLKAKIDFIEEKQKRFRDIAGLLKETESGMMKLRNEVSDANYHLDVSERTLEKCSEIHKLKVSADIAEKIFYGMPLETRRTQEAATQRMLQHARPGPHKTVSAPGSQTARSSGGDVSPVGIDRGVANASAAAAGSAFDQVCLLVAHNIERDWKRLYRALPFVPQRGRETIDRDIAELQNNFIGDSLFECAWRAIQRWRRFHRRAKLVELRSAVERMRRADIVENIDTFLRPPELAENKETPLPAKIDKELIPYYRQIERFDNMRVSTSRESEIEAAE